MIIWRVGLSWVRCLGLGRGLIVLILGGLRLCLVRVGILMLVPMGCRSWIIRWLGEEILGWAGGEGLNCDFGVWA